MITHIRLLGFGLLAMLVIAAVPFLNAGAFGNTIVAVLYAIIFAAGIWLSAPLESRVVRLGWAVGLSIALVVGAAVTNALIAPGEEGGVIGSVIVFGFYLGLPILLFASLLIVSFKPGMTR